MPARTSAFFIIPLDVVAELGGANFSFDATTSRTRDRSGQAIRHAKESGSESLVDDVNLDEVSLSVTGHITDHPLYFGPSFAGYPGRSTTVVRGLRAIQAAKARCTVIFGDDIYTSMVLESISEPRDSSTGDGVDADITMTQVEVGSLKLVAAVPDAIVQALKDEIVVGWLP